MVILVELCVCVGLGGDPCVLSRAGLSVITGHDDKSRACQDRFGNIGRGRSVACVCDVLLLSVELMEFVLQ